MNGRTSLLAAAVVLGLLADLLLRVSGPPGLNVPLWCIAGVLAVALLVVRRGRPASLESVVLMVVALLFISGMALRDAEALRALNLLAAAVAVSLAAAEAGGAWIRSAGVGGYVKAGTAIGLSLAAGPLNFIGGPHESVVPATTTTVRWRRGSLAGVRGVLLATPPLLVLGGLLMAADPVFARVITDTFRIDVARIAEHVLVIGFFAWASTGYLYAFVMRSPFTRLSVPLPAPRIGMLDATIAMSLLNALFLAFVVVQLRYLFGGATLVEVTPGLSYAEYARRGFFELLTVAALVLPLLLLADWSVVRERARDERVFRFTAGAQIVLLFAIIASALYRMRLYLQAYGLTESRLYATVFMLWIAIALVWLAATVLRARRRRFAFGALVAAIIAAAALDIVNPHAFIVQVNARRAVAGHVYDAAYDTGLSGDAVPILLDVWPDLPPADRCRLSRRLLEKWSPAADTDWRTWNLGDRRARRAVAGAAPHLRAACDAAAS